MIKEVCKKLKEKRRVLGYSIEYVVEKTKLYPSVIRNIEDGNLGTINSAYIKGFMKIYSHFLGVDLGTSLDEVEPVISLEKKYPQSSILSKLASKKESIPKKVDYSKVFAFLTKMAGRVSAQARKKIALLLVTIISLWIMFAAVRGIVRAVAGFFKGIPGKEKVAAEQVSPAVVETNKEKAKNAVVRGIEVSLAVKKKCFIRVKVDGKVLFKGVLNKGIIESWKGNKEIEFKISDGSAVSLEVNGKSLPPLTSIRKPIKSLKITPSGITVDK